MTQSQETSSPQRRRGTFQKWKKKKQGGYKKHDGLFEYNMENHLEMTETKLIWP